jgi:hypothetical protein
MVEKLKKLKETESMVDKPHSDHPTSSGEVCKIIIYKAC